MARSRGLWLAILLGIGGLLGCSNGRSCSEPLEQSGCKPTFDMQVEFGKSISPSLCALAGACGAHLVWRTQPGDGIALCVYDSSGQQLLFVKSCGDVPLACGDLCMTGGQTLDVEKDCNTRDLPTTCENADGGIDQGG